MFEANGRYDGTSRFPKNNRFGFFPIFLSRLAYLGKKASMKGS